MKKFQLLIACILLGVNVFAQQIDDNLPKDEQIVRSYFNSVSHNRTDSTHFSPDGLMTQAALFLLNTPYVANTLEGNAEETLVVNLHALDCMTFVENCLALSRAAQLSYPDYTDFVRQLKEIRYREGRIVGYTSRLHYTSDWITDNAAKGTIEDITYALGGKRLQVRVGFMSAHPDRYQGLKENTQDVEVMINIENTINQRNTYHYIPKAEIKSKQSLIKNGDIVCFTTSIPGLDISHLGIAYWDKGQLSFIHASTKYNKVIINPESLADYCGAMKTNTGIMVLRSISAK